MLKTIYLVVFYHNLSFYDNKFNQKPLFCEIFENWYFWLRVSRWRHQIPYATISQPIFDLFLKFLFVCVEEMPSFNLTLESDKSIQKWLIPEGRVLATSPLVNDVVEKGLVNEGLRTIRCFCHNIQNAVILQCICIWWRHVFLKNQSLSIFFCTLETSHF